MKIPKKLSKLKERLEFANLTEKERVSLMNEYNRQIRLLFNQVLRPDERSFLLKKLEIKIISIKDEYGNELPFKEKKKKYKILKYVRGKVPRLISKISWLLKLKEKGIFESQKEKEMIKSQISETMNKLVSELRLTKDLWDWRYIETIMYDQWGEENKNKFFENNPGLIQPSKKHFIYAEILFACILISGFIGIFAFLFAISTI